MKEFPNPHTCAYTHAKMHTHSIHATHHTYHIPLSYLTHIHHTYHTHKHIPYIPHIPQIPYPITYTHYIHITPYTHITPYKCEDPSSAPQHPHESLDVTGCPCNPCDEDRGTGGCGRFTDIQPLSELQVQPETLSQKLRWKIIQGDT